MPQGNLKVTGNGKLVQIRPIQAGEALTLDYGVGFWVYQVTGLDISEWLSEGNSAVSARSHGPVHSDARVGVGLFEAVAGEVGAFVVIFFFGSRPRSSAGGPGGLSGRIPLRKACWDIVRRCHIATIEDIYLKRLYLSKRQNFDY